MKSGSVVDVVASPAAVPSWRRRRSNNTKGVTMFTVAGVTGHVGSVVAAELLDNAALLDNTEPVRVLVRSEAKGKDWADKGAEIAVADLTDRDALAEALRGTEGFFALLPMNPASTAPDAENFRMVDAIAGAVADADVGHVVMLSSLGAELAEGTGPIRYLHHLENGLRSTGTVLTALRCTHFQENAADLLGPVLGEGVYPVFAESPDEPTPRIATRDIGRFAAQTLRERPTTGDIIDLLGPEYSERQVAEILGNLLGREIAVATVPRDEWAGALEQSGMPKESAAVIEALYAADADGLLRPQAQRRHTFDTSAVETLGAIVAAAV
jgi:uncharacterized protein YbjT (DUF2867 family)